MNRLNNSDFPVIYLSPGELYIAKSPSIITTILGSCVSVCLYTKSFEIGAMCHCLLPCSSGRDMVQPFRYMDKAISHILLKINEMNISADLIVSKIFGGADMFNQTVLSVKQSIGHQNIQAAKNILKGYNIPIEKENVGGHTGRKIFFHTGTGEVCLKKISSSTSYNKECLEWLNRK